MEQPLTEALVGYLASRSDVTVYGPRVAESGRRVPVVSFTAKGMPSAEISARLQVRRLHFLRSTACARARDILEVKMSSALEHSETAHDVSCTCSVLCWLRNESVEIAAKTCSIDLLASAVIQTASPVVPAEGGIRAPAWAYVRLPAAEGAARARHR